MYQQEKKYNIMITLTKLAQSLLVHQLLQWNTLLSEAEYYEADKYGGDESCTISKLK